MKRNKPQLYLDRSFDSILLAWKGREDRLPLIIDGARQIGKSECVRHFAEGRYASFVEINFAEEMRFKDIVRDGFSVESIVRNLSQIEPRFQFVPDDTLIFFDELQEFPEIATSLKFFAQDGRYDVICSGSLLGINVRRIKSFSVGYQETETMRSMDFGEFLQARGYTTGQIEDIYGQLLEARPLNVGVCEALDRLFLDFCALGGMPEVVESYFVKGTFERVPFLQKRLLSDYAMDIRKYAEGLDPARIQSVFESIAPQLARENKKFQLSAVARGARRKDYWGCIDWLKQAGVINLCHRLDFPELPIKAHLEPDFFKVYMADTGLLVAMLDAESQDDIRARRNLGTWKGGLFENVIGEALVKAGAELAYFKRENATLEMDFFLRAGDCIVPVEVKSENARGRSLRLLIDGEHYPDIRWGVKLVHGNVGYSNRILTLPQWAAFLLPRIVRAFQFEAMSRMVS